MHNEPPAGVLSGSELLDELQSEDADRLIVIPLHPGQVSEDEASIDLRLGHYLLRPVRTRLPTLDAEQTPFLEPLGKTVERLQAVSGCDETIPQAAGMELMWQPAGTPAYIQPGEFMLGATLEYVALPPDLCAYVLGRSRWARVGLVVEMASFVQPNYHGCLTLELQNLGGAAIALYPGLKVAHLVVMRTSAATESPKQIVCSTRPEFWGLKGQVLRSTKR